MGRRKTEQTHLRKYPDLAHLPPKEYRKEKTARDFVALQAAGKSLWKQPEKVRHYNRLRRYKMTPEQYDAMWEAQAKRCALCAKETPRPVIDHCHDTGRVRGILCTQCNTGLGKFGDSPEMLMLAIEYLTKGAE